MALSSSPWRTVKKNDLNLSIHDSFYSDIEARAVFRRLEEEILYLDGDEAKVFVYGKWRNVPRSHTAYGDRGVEYTFSRRTVPAKPWTPILKEIRERLAKETGHDYNFVLVNRYSDGSQCMGEHRDDEKEIDENVPIASLSFGDPRDFIFRHRDLVTQKKKKEDFNAFQRYSLLLKNGSCLLMKFPTNKFWYHSLPSRKRSHGTRINLTFRKIKT